MAAFGSKQGGSTAGRNNNGKNTGWSKQTSKPGGIGSAPANGFRNGHAPKPVGKNARKGF
jgi:hypothetical protein